ncbi:ABC transporter permease [Paenibacillus motobuensis]|uniref:ABC transporter permease n=1 Tax=Paenibacillus motobuensis TaxID=295324 RepID=A0ABN0YTD9_9BACL
MHKLVFNEWLKLFKKRSFFIAYLVIAVFVIGAAYFIAKLSGDEVFNARDFVFMAMSPSGFGTLLLFLVVVGTAGVVSKEYGQGTIKLLLIRAQSRGKILLSKYISIVLYILSLMLTMFVISFITGTIAFGAGAPSVSWNDIAQTALYTLVYTVIYATITFMLGVLTRSTGITVGLTMFLMMLEGLIVGILAKYSFTKYLIFANTDLSKYVDGGSPLPGMTMSFSVIVIAVYMALFLMVSFVTFKKRDVA